MVLNRLAVIQGESLSSYLYRFSLRNHYPSVFYIAHLLDISENYINNNEFDIEDLSVISTLTEQTTEQLAMMAGLNIKHQMGITFLKKLIMKRRVKYCMECIKPVPFLKFEWTLHPLDTCIDHRLKLIEFCPGCNRAILLKDLILCRCSSCDFNFQKIASPVRVEPSSVYYFSQLEVQQRFKGIPSEHFFPGFTLHSYLSLAYHSFYLLEGLNSFIDEKERIIQFFYNKCSAKQTSDNMANAWANFYWMYHEFPLNFYRVLDAFHIQKKNQIKYFLLKRFEGLFSDEAFHFIRDAYNEFWIKKVDEGSIRKDFAVFKNNPTLLEKRNYIRKDEIRNSIGMSYEFIEKLNDEQKINLVIKENGSLKGYLIGKESLNDALILKGTLISRKEAAFILGIERGSIQRLINAGVLKTYKLTSTSTAKLDREEVITLLDSCRGTVVKNITEGYISFHHALIKFSVCHLTVDRIIEYTQKGMLHPVRVSAGNNFIDNYYLIDELNNCNVEIKAAFQEAVGYYMSDVMRILHIGEKKMRRYIEEGKIVPQRIVSLSDGRKHYLFDKDEIDVLIDK
ncbi:hypothetical protein FE784_23950 [Paenibacillus hemerocallicola]|uniref:TniQ domain-containing protein n=1 Tax=Paenibacillus hemerocallicola TaxID=1172614 RepID=A0A5C4T4H5_9BACL|nr:TniQ family protein [Paenibacillus hemerocallicola]TNJ63776.1 hypothetical protein FE784_23950 [Paenibacillus hemerocallicola]